MKGKRIEINTGHDLHIEYPAQINESYVKNYRISLPRYL
jgi:hypothetical protein